jgi:hypothetical protein
VKLAHAVTDALASAMSGIPTDTDAVADIPTDDDSGGKETFNSCD